MGFLIQTNDSLLEATDRGSLLPIRESSRELKLKYPDRLAGLIRAKKYKHIYTIAHLEQKGNPEMITDVGAENLAAAIIENALKDYEATYSHLLYLDGQKGRTEEKGSAREEVEVLEKWLHSDWYYMLTDLDPDMLIKGVKEKVRRKRHI